MRKILLNLAISLDGFIEGPNGEYDWCFTDQDYGMEAFVGRTDTIFFGRKSYELLLRTDPTAWSSHKRYVFSTTLASAEGATLIHDDAAQAVRALKQQEGKDIWLFGGAVLTHSLLNLQLIDEMHLSVHPVLLGSGKPLFGNSEQRKLLQLTACKAYESGLVQVQYSCKNE